MAEEFVQIKIRENRLRQKMSNNNTHLDANKCFVKHVLGLESHQEWMERCQDIQRSQDALFQEQENQRKKSQVLLDAEQLARVYARSSYHSTRAARNRGMNVEILLRNLELTDDEKEPQQLSQEENASKPSFSIMKNRRWSPVESSYRSTTTTTTTTTNTNTATTSTPSRTSKCPKMDLPPCTIDHLRHHHSSSQHRHHETGTIPWQFMSL
jgi:hypothetical protein